MQNVTKPAIAIGVLAALGLGAYTWGQHTGAGPSTLPNQSPAVSTTAPMASPFPTSGYPPAAPSTLAPVPVVGAGAPPAAPLPQGASSGYSSQSIKTSTPGVAPVASAQNWQTQSGQTTETTTLTKETPVAGAPTTYVQEKTVTQTTPARTAYTTRVVHYKHHKTDKVHVARATKHGAMFALKLPGRLAF